MGAMPNLRSVILNFQAGFVRNQSGVMCKHHLAVICTCKTSSKFPRTSEHVKPCSLT
jgi:hypothetical protein